MKLCNIKRKKQKKTKVKETGFILWEGVSPVDNRTPIVAIATMESKNAKTGNMIQTWIIRTDVEPNKAVKSASDSAICGSCKFKSGGGCYVRAEQAPLAVYKAYKRGNYAHVTVEQIPLIAVNREVRLGAYGDPAMVPYHIWEALIKNASGHTGYTHQQDAQYFDARIAKICMISADTVQDSKLYNRLGFRTFTAIDEREEMPKGQLVCPNFTHGITCRDCKLCNGSSGNGKSIVAVIHGTSQKINKFKANREG